MNEPRRMHPPHRCSPPNRQAPGYDLNRQQRRAATYSAYDGYEYDYDTMPVDGGRSRRSMETPRSHPSGSQETVPPQRRPFMPAQPQPRKPFGQAAAQLHAILSESRGFFENFLGNFEKDVSGVKGFAGQCALECLWKDKIKATSHSRSQAPGQQQMDFRNMCSTLQNGLYQAANSGPRRPPPRPVAGTPKQQGRGVDEDASSLMRLVKKLQGQYRDLSDLIEGSRRSFRATADLVKDINLLLQVLDQTRNLWEQSNAGYPPDYVGTGNPWPEEDRY
jgi:hypothetical protein